jgi:hypothetical protein
MGSATYRDDLDRAVGLALTHRRVLCWIDEVGELTRANSTPPNMRRALHQGRHHALSLLCCCPRPIDVDTLVMSQADFVYAFKLPNPRDRRRMAEVCGIAPAELDEAMHALGPYEFLRYDAHDSELVQFPKLPAALPREKPREDNGSSRGARIDVIDV